MGKFLEFVQASKQAFANIESFKNIHLVLGNESCDLDSTVSALALSYLIYSKQYGQVPQHLVLPVMNVCAKYFPLRTETCYVLKQCGIEPNILTFKDQLEYAKIYNRSVETTIVDHHVLCEHDKILEDTVVQIFDHRPINSVEICKNPRLSKTIKSVGSCSTLITNEIIASDPQLLSKELSYLLYATIIYDTIGLDRDCGKTFDEDVTAAEHLESILKVTQTRKELFDELWKIHNDTSNLSTKELLYRDLKVVQGVPIPGLPLLVEDYLKREDSGVAIRSFADDYDCKNVVLIGIDASGTVKRDIGIYFTSPQFRDILVEVLKSSKESAGSDLLLSEVLTKHDSIVCFRQDNIKLTRKFILPLVNVAARRVFTVTDK